MNLKEFDWKQFMLQKGERVGLYSAAGIGGALLIWSIAGVFGSGSPSRNAKDLNGHSERVNSLVANAQAPEDLTNVDPTLMAGAKFSYLNAIAFRDAKDFFEPLAVDNSKRLSPEVLTPVEWDAKVAFVQVRSYIYDREGKRVAVLRGSSKRDPRSMASFGSFAAGAAGGGPRGGAGAGGIGGMMSPGAMGGGMSATGSPDGDGGGAGMMSPGMGMPGMPGGPGMPAGMSAEGGKDPKVEFTEFDNVAKLPDASLAETLRPLRMALITGSFPYKKQLEEYRKALRYKTVDELMNSEDAPLFRGWVVERRTVGKDGKFSPWQPIDLAKSYKPIIALTGGRFEEEDPKLESLRVRGLVMMRPVQAREKQYPKFETDLPRIKETLKAIEEAGKVKLVGTGGRFTGEEVDIFGNETDKTTPQNPVAPPGVQPSAPGSQLAGSSDASIPEYVPIRIIDVTVRPGETYQYRVQFLAANPNYQRKQDVAYSELAKEKEIKSKFVVVGEVPVGADGQPAVQQTVAANIPVPPELVYYAVDEKEQEKKNKDMPSKDRKHTLASDLIASGEYRDKAAVQIHKWADFVSTGDKKTVFPSGEWLVADRVFANRGEYLGRAMPTEVPIWLYTRDEFILAPNPNNPRDKRISFDFGTRNGPPDEAILVDFEGGKLTYEKGRGRPVAEDQKQRTERVEAPAPVELLILAADGKTLLARDSESDSNDPVRDERRKNWRARIDKLKNKQDTKTAPQGPAGAADLFGGGKPGGGK